MKNDTAGTLAWVAIILLIFLTISGGGGTAPFPTKEPLVCLIVEDVKARTVANDTVMDAVEASVKAASGKVRRLDSSSQKDLSKEEQWVQDAWKVSGGKPQWIVAATPYSGVNQALPADKDAAVALVKRLGGK